jgi:hypothetical protein
MINLGMSLFDLADKQLKFEAERHIKPKKPLVIKKWDKVAKKVITFTYPYRPLDILKYAIKIRRWLDKHPTQEKVNAQVYGKSFVRRQRYLRTGK